MVKIPVENESEPLMKFEGDASAPILRYDVPSPSSYVGKTYIETDLGQKYFGGDKILKSDDPNELFRIIKKRFLRENRDVIKEFLSTIKRTDLEEELNYFSLKEEDIDTVILEQAKIEAAKKGAKAARLRAKNVRRIADQKKGRATKLKKQADKMGKGLNALKAQHKKAFGHIKFASKFQIGVIEKKFKALKANAVSAANDANAAQIAADKAEKRAIAAEERISGEESKEVDVLDLIDLEGMEETQSKYILFKHLMDIAWKVDKKFPLFYKTMGGTPKIRFAKVRNLEPKLIFVEAHKLTNFPGDYGAGTTIKTFSLLPGEETEISIKTYKKSKEDTKEASSILDSYTEEKADEFEKGVQQENARTSKEENSSSYSVKAEAGVSFGCVSASVEAGMEASASASREEVAKNVMNATEKHAQKASSKRDVNINTSFERSEEVGEEISIMRRIENLNSSRTLNFTFRQMNQQFHSILHLCDLRIGFYNGYPGSMREYTLCELGHLVQKYMKIPNKTHNEIYEDLKQKIFNEYTNVIDYQGNSRTLIEEAQNGNGGPSYLKVIPPMDLNGKKIGQQEYIMRDARKDDKGNIIQPKDIRYLEGVILTKKVITMKTDGIIVEALLGKANALDDYSLDARKEKIREKKFENNLKKANVRKIKTGLEIINAFIDDKQYDKAKDAFNEIFGIQEGIQTFSEIFGPQRLELNK